MQKLKISGCFGFFLNIHRNTLLEDLFDFLSKYLNFIFGQISIFSDFLFLFFINTRVYGPTPVLLRYCSFDCAVAFSWRIVKWKQVVSNLMRSFCLRERVLNSTSLEQTIQQLKPSTSYEFRVVAWNSHGPSPQAARTELVTLPEGQCEWVSSYLTAHQHILGYSVPFIHSVLFTVW